LRNSLVRKEDVERIARVRFEVCRHCELLDEVGDSCMIPGTQPCCRACGCKLSFKIRSLSSECAHPDGPKWKALLSQEEEDNLYEKIEYNPDKEV
jgi:hypothetical protein